MISGPFPLVWRSLAECRSGWLTREESNCQMVLRIPTASNLEKWLFVFNFNFLGMKEDHRSERKVLQRFEHPHLLEQLARGGPRETRLNARHTPIHLSKKC
jgi:hypothetical protein